jgi:redox-sensitive bicupin YhaK (pirin superfamily)
MITLRPAAERGHAEHGWLDSFHSFSFAGYHDPDHMGYGPLRVINEDRVKPGMGFGTHGHRDMEIISYVIEGSLAHKDSIGTGSTIVPGDVQRMSAGRGVMHSEFNPSSSEGVHFLQIWIEPAVRGIAPSYEQANVADDAKRGKLALIAAPAGAGGAVEIHQDAKLYATLLQGGERVVHPLAAGRRAYVHIVRGTATVNGVEVSAGDAVKLEKETSVAVEHRGEAMLTAEVLVFDLP